MTKNRQLIAGALGGVVLGLSLLAGSYALADDAGISTLNPFKVVAGVITERTATNTQLTNLTITGTCTNCGSGGGGGSSTPAGLTNSLQYKVDASTFGGTTFFQRNGGQLGINSSTPAAFLSVVGSSTISTTFPLLTVASSSNAAYFSVLPSGNVGIGTQTPSQLLNVYRNTSNTTPMLLVEEDGSGDAALSFSLTGTQQFTMGIDNSTTGDMFVISDSAALGTTNRIVIDSSGNVGIASSTPSAPLSLVGNFYQTGQYAHFGNGLPRVSCAGDGCIDLWGTDNTINGIGLTAGNRSNGTNAFSYLVGNNDLLDPALLDGIGGIQKNGSQFATTVFGTIFNVPSGLFLFDLDSSIGIVSSSSTNSSVFIATGGSDTANKRLTVTGTGEVGIGTTTPTQTLTVVGNIQVTTKPSCLLGTDANGIFTCVTRSSKIPILSANILPDTSGNVYVEPFTISTSTAYSKHATVVYRDSGTNTCAYGSFYVPNDYGATNATITPVWAANATSGNIVSEISYVATAPDENMAKATADQTASSTKAISATLFGRTNGDIPITAGNLAARDVVNYRLCRLGADANDTLAATATLQSLLFEYDK